MCGKGLMFGFDFPFLADYLPPIRQFPSLLLFGITLDEPCEMEDGIGHVGL